MSAALVLWRFRRCFRERNFVHRSVYANGICNLGQPIAVAIRDMPGADTVYPFLRRANNICSVRRDSNADEHVADSCGQARKLHGGTLQAKRSLGEGCVHGCIEYYVGGEQTAGGPVIEWPVLSVPSGLDRYLFDPFPEALWIEIDFGGSLVFFR